MTIVGEEFANRKIAVTGSRGFIGRALVSQLEEYSAPVLPLKGDVCLTETWQGEFDLLYHLAAAMPAVFGDNPYKSYSVNLAGTLSALEACRVRGAHMVFVSTCGVYCPTNEGPISERNLTNPQTAYAQSKLMGEMLCHSYSRDYGVQCTILRLFNVYGEHQKAEFLIPYLVACGRDQMPATIYNINSARDFLHVDDVVQALVKVPSLTKSFGIFNIGSGTATTTQQIIDLIGHFLSQPLIWNTGEGRLDPQPVVQADITLATQELGWVPQVSLEAGLEMVVRALTKA